MTRLVFTWAESSSSRSGSDRSSLPYEPSIPRALPFAPFNASIDEVTCRDASKSAFSRAFPPTTARPVRRTASTHTAIRIRCGHFPVRAGPPSAGSSWSATACRLSLMPLHVSAGVMDEASPAGRGTSTVGVMDGSIGGFVMPSASSDALTGDGTADTGGIVGRSGPVMLPSATGPPVVAFPAGIGRGAVSGTVGSVSAMAIPCPSVRLLARRRRERSSVPPSRVPEAFISSNQSRSSCPSPPPSWSNRLGRMPSFMPFIVEDLSDRPKKPFDPVERAGAVVRQTFQQFHVVTLQA